MGASPAYFPVLTTFKELDLAYDSDSQKNMKMSNNYPAVFQENHWFF
jgi:hypothetical protein